MKLTGKRRSGFTLPEVLVTVSIIAIISAVVVPSVVRQIDKGDTGRLASDISSIRTGVEQFISDVRKYPENVGQISHAISTSDTAAVSLLPYTDNQVARWKGPYVSKDSTGILKTAYGWSFDPHFVIDSFTVSPYTKGLAIRTDSARDKSQVAQLDTLLDDGNLSAGTIRYRGSGTIGRLVVVLVPIQ
jgi:prepilin-type N-terminal cleavage/methylation domain-containing protein